MSTHTARRWSWRYGSSSPDSWQRRVPWYVLVGFYAGVTFAILAVITLLTRLAS